MENGKYGSSNTKFTKLTLDRFDASMFDAIKYMRTGCGANALALLTGKHPARVSRLNKHRNHFSDRFMLAFLRKHGFKTFKITKCNLTSRNTDFEMGQLSDNHLMLMSQLLKPNEASWVVYWNGIQYHNFELSKANFWNLLNLPIISAYVLYKNEWK
jgi:hypothetical protein